LLITKIRKLRTKSFIILGPDVNAVYLYYLSPELSENKLERFQPRPIFESEVGAYPSLSHGQTLDFL
jgi:hypothetical protein